MISRQRLCVQIKCVYSIYYVWCSCMMKNPINSYCNASIRTKNRNVHLFWYSKWLCVCLFPLFNISCIVVSLHVTDVDDPDAIKQSGHVRWLSHWILNLEGREIHDHKQIRCYGVQSSKKEISNRIMGCDVNYDIGHTYNYKTVIFRVICFGTEKIWHHLYKNFVKNN